MVVRGHFDGQQIVLDEPVPEHVNSNAPVEVRFLEEPSKALDEIAKLARPCGLPPDFSEQFEHYVKGLPRR